MTPYKKFPSHVLLLLGSILIFSFALIQLVQYSFYAFLVLIATIGMTTLQYMILKNTTSVLKITEDTVYIYYGGTENGNLILSRLCKDGTSEDGIYSNKNIEWFEDPIMDATYIYRKIGTRDFLCLYTEKETIRQEK